MCNFLCRKFSKNYTFCRTTRKEKFTTFVDEIQRITTEPKKMCNFLSIGYRIYIYSKKYTHNIIYILDRDAVSGV